MKKRENPEGLMGTISICHGKLHRVTVTQAKKEYEGSITIDEDLVEAAGLADHEYVNITNNDRGDFWRTYIMLGPRGSGIICANGTAAWHFAPGDRVIILGETQVPYEKRHEVRPLVVMVDEKNRITEVRTYDLTNNSFTTERFSAPEAD